jgi:dienelactone hydrolase
MSHASIALVFATMACAAPLPKPSGPYAVGVALRTFVDSTRGEPWTTGDAEDRRVLTLRVWYPADSASGGAPVYLPYAAELGVLQRAGGRSDPGATARVGASVRREPAVFPVVLISPGADLAPSFYSGLIEDWASHGYVVVGVDHAHEGIGQFVEEGAVLRPDPEGRGAAFGNRIDEARAAAFEAYYRFRVDLRAADCSAIIDLLGRDALAPLGLPSHRLEWTRVAIVGHSIGGVAAVTALARDRRVAYAINMDGLFRGTPGYDALADSLTRAVAYLGRPLQGFGRDPLQSMDSRPSSRIEADSRVGLWLGRTPEAVSVILERATHGAFSDEPFWWGGSRDATDLLQRLRDITAQLLDAQLRNGPRPRIPPMTGVVIQEWRRN